MTEENPLQAIYRIHDFWAMEDFDAPEYNTKPHQPQSPGANGHCYTSIGSIDESLIGGTVKDAVDFLAEHDGVFRKEHSNVRAINVHFIRDGGGEVGKLPTIIEVPFEHYVAQGRPEVVSLTLAPHSG